MYQNYCNNYSAAATRLAALRKKTSSAFSKYCDEQSRSKQFNRLNIESLLILPIQRMPRYKMLLEEIIKNTESDHPDLEQLQTALSQIAAVNDSINSKMKDFDAMKRVQNIENLFSGKVTNLVTPSRRYIREGTLCKIERKDDRDYLFILFNDCIIYASPSPFGDKLVFHQLLPFNELFRVQISQRVRVPNMFELHSTKESFMVYAQNKKECDEWFNDIEATYKRQRVKLQRHNKRRGTECGRTRPILIPNDFADKCMMKCCDTKFSFVNRRHHCKYWFVISVHESI